MTDHEFPVELNAAGYAALLDKSLYAAPQKLRLPSPRPVPVPEEERLKAIRDAKARRERRG